MPLQRGQAPAEHVARGVAVGLAVAFTPTVGVQLVMVLLIWMLAKAAGPRFRFHAISAFAWVWVTNIFTIGPIYYGFLLTGQLLLGRFDELGGIGLDQFTAQLTAIASADTGFIEALWVGTLTLFEIWGIPLFLGSVPWAIIFSWAGYVWSKRFIERFRARRAQRQKLTRERRGGRFKRKGGSGVGGAGQPEQPRI
ncbi:MAG: DUF2062 domain-containing protein [Minwuia sp.]|nr:DUF2062 domain-containing protein [Minwuia sp.]